MNSIDLGGKAAVITGGASGLGLTTAERLLRSGARVMIWDKFEDLLESACVRLEGLGLLKGRQLDIGDVGAVGHAAREAEASLGGIDILVNCAGITRPPAPIAGYPLEHWTEIMEINLSGTFFCCRAVLPGMVARGYGRVANVSSMAGKDGHAHETAYSVAKAGLIGLTKSLGRELAGTGVLVNAIAPGAVETRMRTSAASPELVNELMKRTPLGRPGTREEFAGLVAWVVSEECSCTTGFTFDFSGGRAVH